MKKMLLGIGVAYAVSLTYTANAMSGVEDISLKRVKEAFDARNNQSALMGKVLSLSKEEKIGLLEMAFERDSFDLLEKLLTDSCMEEALDSEEMRFHAQRMFYKLADRWDNLDALRALSKTGFMPEQDIEIEAAKAGYISVLDKIFANSNNDTLKEVFLFFLESGNLDSAITFINKGYKVKEADKKEAVRMAFTGGDLEIISTLPYLIGESWQSMHGTIIEAFKKNRNENPPLHILIQKDLDYYDKHQEQDPSEIIERGLIRALDRLFSAGIAPNKILRLLDEKNTKNESVWDVAAKAKNPFLLYGILNVVREYGALSIIPSCISSNSWMLSAMENDWPELHVNDEDGSVNVKEKIISLLIENSTRLIADSSDNNLLHAFAKTKNNTQAMIELLDRRVGTYESSVDNLINQINISGKTPLYVAMENGNSIIADYLVKNDAYYETADLLPYAVAGGNISIVRWVVNNLHGLNEDELNTVFNDLNLPFHKITKKRIEKLSLEKTTAAILYDEREMDPIKFWTLSPLQIAAEKKDGINVLKFLFEKGKLTLTPQLVLSIVGSGNVEAVRWLAALNKVNAVNNKDFSLISQPMDEMILHAIDVLMDESEAALLNELRELRTTPELEKLRGISALSSLFESANLDAVKTLFENNIIDIKDLSSPHLFALAVKSKNTDFVKWLWETLTSALKNKQIEALDLKNILNFPRTVRYDLRAKLYRNDMHRGYNEDTLMLARLALQKRPNWLDNRSIRQLANFTLEAVRNFVASKDNAIGFKAIWNRVLPSQEDTLLHIAVKNNDIDMVKLLYPASAGNKKDPQFADLAANKHTRDKYGNTLIFNAIKNQNLDMVKLLKDIDKDAGMSMNLLCDTSITSDLELEEKTLPILWLMNQLKNCIDSDIENTPYGKILSYLLEISEDDAFETKGKCDQNGEITNAFEFALSLTKNDVNFSFFSRNYFKKILKRILLKKYKVDVSNKEAAKQSFFRIAEKGSGSAIEAIKLCWPDLDMNMQDTDGNTLLNAAISSGNTKTALALINNPAVDLGLKNARGRSPLYTAVNKKNYDVVKALINKDRSLAKIDTASERNILHIAAENKDADLVKLILNEKLVDKDLLNAQDINGDTFIHIAAKKDSRDIISKAVQFRSDIQFDILNKEQCAPIHLTRDVYIFRLLLSAAENKNITDWSGRNLLYFALYFNDKTSLTQLLKEGLDPNTADCFHISPLAYAISYFKYFTKHENHKLAESCRSLIVTLIEHGANIDIPSAFAECNDENYKKFYLEAGTEKTTPWNYVVLLHKNAEDPHAELLKDMCLHFCRRNMNSDSSLNILTTPHLLHFALDNKYNDLADMLISAPAVNINEEDRPGETPLTLALKYRNFEVLELLLSRKDLCLTNKYENEENIFHIAARYDNGTLIRTILNMELIPLNMLKEKNSNGDTFFQIAVRGSNLEVIGEILKHEKLVELSKEILGMPLLHSAIRKKQDKLAMMLIDTPDVDVSEKDQKGNTPLSLAVRYGNGELVKRLLKKKDIALSLDKTYHEGRNILHIAAQYDDDDLIWRMLSNKSNSREILNTVNNYGETPLHVAVLNNSQIVIKEMIKHKDLIDFNARDSFGCTPIMLTKGNRELLALLTPVIDCSQKDPIGGSLLNCAVYWRRIEWAEQLLKTGLDPNMKNDFGVSPLAYAISNFRYHIECGENDEASVYSYLILLLIEHGADINLKSNYVRFSKDNFNEYDNKPEDGEYSPIDYVRSLVQKNEDLFDVLAHNMIRKFEEVSKKAKQK